MVRERAWAIAIGLALMCAGCPGRFEEGYLDPPPPDAGADAGRPGCPAGTERCGAECVDTRSHTSNCGGCGRACASSEACRGGECVGCPSGTTPCGPECVDRRFDARHCGACDHACDGACEDSACVCPAETADCDEEPGCDDLRSDPDHCGGCDRPCPPEDECRGGVCLPPDECPPEERCSGECVDLGGDARHCGECGRSCAALGAPGVRRHRCAAGECVVGECLFDLADCDGDMANGCEVDLRYDPDHCGACGRACPFAQTCLDLDCRDHCPATCDGRCADLDRDPAHCGACGRVCALPHALSTCEGGACWPRECEEGWEDLDGEPGNGCEHRIGDPEAERCNGVDDDEDGETDEGFDLRYDPEHCGRCGARCVPPPREVARCFEGECAFDCAPGSARDPGGGCSPCGEAETCDNRDDDCDGEIDEGFDLLSDSAHCGVCGRACAPAPRATVGCRYGGCAITSCDPGFVDLDRRVDNGCEAACDSRPEDPCNGRDDDCDGEIDETFPPLGSRCGLDEGRCRSGFLECGPTGVLECRGDDIPHDETCNAMDDDCDGETDEGDFGPCDPGPGFDCGLLRCTAALELLCVGVRSVDEICDGRDQDCDGAIDEEVEEGAPCGVGACAGGALACRGGERVCEGGGEPTTEVCNGLDDDCDSVPDDGVPMFLCGAPPRDACGPLLGRCIAGETVCEVADPGAALPEACNMRDDDCDGAIDEEVPSGGPCGPPAIGACAPGRQECRAGAMICEGARWPRPETCNREDDDCDGEVDEAPMRSCPPGERCVGGECG